MINFPKMKLKKQFPFIEFWWYMKGGIVRKEVKMMTANEYQKLAARTINRELTDYQKKMHALHGLAGEVGELHSLFQKEYQGHEFHEEHAKKEVGDICWMIAEFCTAYGWNLEEIMQMNIDKLKARFPEGFEAEKSLHRKAGDI